jgi:predicted FMN-binding regulatory protein PaiB
LRYRAGPLYHLYEQNNRKKFYGRFVRKTTFFQLLKKKRELALSSAVQRLHAYISPTFYKAKQVRQNVVPTCNYAATQFRGTMKLVPDEEMYSLLEKEVELLKEAAQSEY